MAHIIADRIKEVSSTSGTGSMVLSGAVVGSRTFGSVMSLGDTCYYCIDNDLGDWELGIGTFSSGSLGRTAVLSSSNANSLVDFPSGAKSVFITNPAINIPLLSSGSFSPSPYGGTVAGTPTITAQTGTYLKYGVMVFINMSVTWTAHTGTGNLNINGLPFTVSGESLLTISASSLTMSGFPSARTINGTNACALFYFTTGGAETAVPMDTAATINISGWYRTV